MNTIRLFTLFLCLFASMSSTQVERSLFQVISSHPHDVEELAPYIETVHQSGRLWIVDLKKGAPLTVWQHLRPITGRETSYIYKGGGLKKRNLNAHHFAVKESVKQVDAELIKKDVEELASYTTRAAGTNENRAAVQSIENRFVDMGYDVKQICYRTGVCSVVADKVGNTHPNDILLVLGHMDSVGEAFAGADDNASGTAVILEMARVLKDYENKKTIRFFVTNGEELGLLGATHYVGTLKASGEIKNIKLAINMDMVGYNSNGVVELETSTDLEPLAKWLAELAGQYTKLQTKITLGAWGSDHVPFLKAGVPTILTIEDWSTKTPCYHMECDKPETLNYGYAAEIAKLNVAAVMIKDRQ